MNMDKLKWDRPEKSDLPTPAAFGQLEHAGQRMQPLFTVQQMSEYAQTAIAQKDAEIDRLKSEQGDAWRALTKNGILNTGQPLSQAIRRLPHVDSEIATLTDSLKKANDGFEEFERKWYLAVQDVDGKDAALAEMAKLLHALNVQIATLQAGLGPLTDAQISLAGRVLSDRSADACGIDHEDNWKEYGQGWKDDAHAMLQAVQP